MVVVWWWLKPTLVFSLAQAEQYLTLPLVGLRSNLVRCKSFSGLKKELTFFCVCFCLMICAEKIFFYRRLINIKNSGHVQHKENQRDFDFP